jgi:8-oxo-dGTP pyrophosphatase MutT (NUDIX family)
MRDAPLQSEAERLSLDAASEIDAQARALMQRSTCLGYSKACRRVLAGDDFLSAAYTGDVARLAELCQRGHDIRLGQGGPLSPRGGAPAALAADDLAQRYHGDPAAVAQLEAHGQALELGQGRSSPAPPALAAKEAFEEAGLQGAIGAEPIGRYRYTKQLRGKKRTRTLACEVQVFPLAVTRQLADWPEKGQRDTRWCTPEEAATLVEEGGLVTLLLSLAALDL